ncbi:hypothetical protein MKEN_00376900 [Mycena kentingensis (nom. inval.)]|nr:hypothetical protein MKEN_00376900 [Mycena kentingensis (nom. inval.)]
MSQSPSLSPAPTTPTSTVQRLPTPILQNEPQRSNKRSLRDQTTVAASRLTSQNPISTAPPKSMTPKSKSGSKGGGSAPKGKKKAASTRASMASVVSADGPSGLFTAPANNNTVQGALGSSVSVPLVNSNEGGATSSLSTVPQAVAQDLTRVADDIWNTSTNINDASEKLESATERLDASATTLNNAANGLDAAAAEFRAATESMQAMTKQLQSAADKLVGPDASSGFGLLQASSSALEASSQSLSHATLNTRETSAALDAAFRPETGLGNTFGYAELAPAARTRTFSGRESPPTYDERYMNPSSFHNGRNVRTPALAQRMGPPDQRGRGFGQGAGFSRSQSAANAPRGHSGPRSG